MLLWYPLDDLQLVLKGDTDLLQDLYEEKLNLWDKHTHLLTVPRIYLIQHWIILLLLHLSPLISSNMQRVQYRVILFHSSLK